MPFLSPRDKDRVPESRRREPALVRMDASERAKVDERVKEGWTAEPLNAR
ncbi:MAG TPA: hypothetical protein VMD29_00660 [Terracidiphilus sp.]|nr:hypothetical protein [Terracidiphilus sp.]